MIADSIRHCWYRLAEVPHLRAPCANALVRKDFGIFQKQREETFVPPSYCFVLVLEDLSPDAIARGLDAPPESHLTQC
jgi:hypothetical protein